METKQEVFEALKKILKKYESQLNLAYDKENVYHLNAGINPANKKDMFFGSVNIMKNYVAFHLMPVYVDPSLLDGLTPALKKRMQGKSCFNFTDIQPSLFHELAQLTESGLHSFKTKGYV